MRSSIYSIAILNMAPCIELGFVEKPISKLVSSNFPSKVGGKPAWLNLKQLPSTELLSCKKCGQPMILLLQIYAPIDHVDDCYHRTIFVFFCKTADCCESNLSDNFVVLRCQLQKSNEFYSSDCHPSGELTGDDGPTADDYHKLCNVCGSRGSKSCSRCKTANYCSKQHQLVDWKGGHKEKCCSNTPNSKTISNTFLLPEMEIVIEPENYSETEERSEEDRVKDFEVFLKDEKDNLTLFNDNELEDMASSSSDKQYEKFKKRIRHEPEQVLRYEIDGVPLWVSNENVPNSDQIPKCKCGASRRFEFQILPQLLNYLSLDSMEQSIDWGTIVIYTCSQNCQSDDAYQVEFSWKQDFTGNIN